MCNKTPSEFWDYTPADTNLMIEEASKKRKDDVDFALTLNARICAVIYNAHGIKKENGTFFDTNDFLEGREEVQQDPEQYSLLIKRMNKAMGGREIHMR